MLFDDFCNTIQKNLQEKMGNDIMVEINLIKKNNNHILHGLTIRKKDCNIAPTIYLDYYYEDLLKGKSVAAIEDEIVEVYKKNKSSQNMDLSFFTDYQKVRSNIVFKLVHYEKNKALLEDIPHIQYLDLAIVFCCLIFNSSSGNATILIHNHHLALWKVNTEQLYEIAKKNTPFLLPYEIETMESVLKTCINENSSFGDVDEEELAVCPMSILTNKPKLYGASCILYENVLKNFANKVGHELYALTPEDINFKKKEIRVNKTLVYQKFEGDDGKTYHLGPPKTKCSNRVVPITTRCEAALQKQLKQRSVILNKHSVKPLEGFENQLFLSTLGTPLNATTYCDAIGRIVDTINMMKDPLEQMEKFLGHCFRHTFATRCFEAKIQPKTIQAYLGHATLQMTMDLYTHVTDEFKQDEIEKLENEENKVQYVENLYTM